MKVRSGTHNGILRNVWREKIPLKRTQRFIYFPKYTTTLRYTSRILQSYSLVELVTSISCFAMGWFTKNEDRPNTRAQRKECWDSRDKFFACLDNIGVLNAMDPSTAKDVSKNCSKEQNIFEKNCAASWVKYFKEKRVVDFQRRHLMEKVDNGNGRNVNMTPSSGR